MGAPQKIVDKKAESFQGKLFLGAVASGLISYGCFHNGNAGAGLLFALGAVGLAFWAINTKTTYYKETEFTAAKYRKK